MADEDRYDYTRRENARRLGPRAVPDDVPDPAEYTGPEETETDEDEEEETDPREERREQRRRTQDRIRRSGAARAITASGSGANYQKIILAEFVLAEMFIAITPLTSSKPKGGLSPYVGKDMVRLAATGVAYFGLSLLPLAGRNWGRVGAWLGGLVLLTVGLAGAADIARDFNLFEGGSTAPGEGAVGGTVGPALGGGAGTSGGAVGGTVGPAI